MNGIIIVAGYSKLEYLQTLKLRPEFSEYSLWCIYTRRPKTDKKQQFLTLFDKTLHLHSDETRDILSAHKDSVKAITCTQERDIEVYIDTMEICNFISSEEASLYKEASNKELFKRRLSHDHPELVPTVHTREQFESIDNFPVVLKPTSLAGSSYVHIVHSSNELNHFVDTHIDTIDANTSEFYQRSGNLIAEEHISGNQYSVNAYIDGKGNFKLCPILRVIPANQLGPNDTYSALQYTTDEVSDETLASLQDAITKVITVFSIKNTSAHFDCVLTQTGQWKFFEVGLRIGGNRRKVFELSHGFDHFLNDLRNRLGQEVYLPSQKKSVCLVQNASIQEGVLQEYRLQRIVSKPDQPLVREDKIAKIGDEVKPVSLGGGTISRHVVIGADQESVVNTARLIYESVALQLEIID